MNKNEIKHKIDNDHLAEIKIMLQVGKFSFNILHDLINPITGLALYLENIKDEQLKKNLKPIFDANSEIRDFLKTFQKTVDRPNKTEYVDIEKIIKSSMVLIQHKALKNNVVLNFSRNVAGLKVKMIRLSLYQIMLNLIGNSIDSFENHPDKTKFEKERKYVTVNLSENINNYRLTISDNGSGIKKETLEKIFNKNFTTKKRGFGIGLNTVQYIVENQIKGKIGIKTKWGEGTKFNIYIPKEITKI